jgi:amidase
MSAVALARAIASRQISCVEVMEATLDRIAAINPRVNAIIALCDRAALIAEARARDHALAHDAAPGPLYGFPLAVKDLAAVKGLALTKGSPILENYVADADSVMVERLRAAGAIFIGKTNTPEFGLGSQTSNPVHGATRNAYDPALTAGGSSGGAAVAVALKMLAVADGTDVGGSLRNPAGWNNIFGFRPSIGLVASDRVDAWLPSMNVAGPMARSVADLALLLSVQAGFDARDPFSLAGDGVVFRKPLDAKMRGKRIAWAGDFGGALPYEPGVLDLCKTALKTFEDLGCIVEEARPDFSFADLWRAFTTLRAWQTGASLLEYYNDPAKRKMMKPEAIFEVETGLKLSAFDISAASALRTQWHNAVQRFFETFDAFVLPTAQVFPFAVETMWPQKIAGKAMASYHEWMQCAVPATMAGSPALAAPAGFNQSGLPMGIQIIGPHRGDLNVLRLGHAYDSATRWPERRPPPLLGGDPLERTALV